MNINPLASKIFSIFKRKSPVQNEMSSSSSDSGGDQVPSDKYWISDDKVKECYNCKLVFSTFRRRHHCRVCGQIFCNKCASIVNGVKFGFKGEMRVCEFCLKFKISDFKPVAEMDSKLSMDSRYGSLERLWFSRKDEDNFREPFRTNFEDEIEIEESEPTEEYTHLFMADDQLPKSFLNFSTTALEDKRSPLLARRKFSSRINTQQPKIRLSSLQSELELQEEGLPYHFRSISAALNLEINAASVNHVRLLMHQMLKRGNLEGKIKLWEDVIINLLLKVCHRLKPNIRTGDSIDIRNYVKIKKIPGGYITDSHYVNGVVVTKDVLHKKMLGTITNAKILLVTFPIEYQRVENQYISLAPIIAQEKEHLKNLVRRLTAIGPDVILTEKSVAGIAVKYFLEFNVVIIQNVKSSVLSAVSNCTGAEVISSFDRLDPKCLGMCGSFSINPITNPAIPGFRKSYMYVQDCEKESACTLVLRGANLEMLRYIKKVVDFLVFVVYSLKLETCLFQDHYSQTPAVHNFEYTNIAELTLGGLIKGYHSIILSGSPMLTYPPPFMLNRAISDLKQWLAKQSEKHSDFNSVEDVTDAGVKKIIAYLQSLDPITQQKINVLVCKVCRPTFEYCEEPHIHSADFYGELDLALGQFIEDTCFTAKFACTLKSCEQ